MPKVLIVEDDISIAKSLKMNLSYDGFDVTVADHVASGWDLISTHAFDILLLDVTLPDGNGVELCERIRGSGKRMPILFLSARTDEETVVRGINKGADDYIRKPFGVEELKARMNKLLNRTQQARNTLTFKDLVIDLGTRSVKVGDVEIALNRREFDVLVILANKPEEVVTREYIMNHLAQEPDAYDRIIDSHISHLRRKLRDSIGEKLLIMPVYGVGYRLRWK